MAFIVHPAVLAMLALTSLTSANMPSVARPAACSTSQDASCAETEVAGEGLSLLQSNIRLASSAAVDKDSAVAKEEATKSVGKAKAAALVSTQGYPVEIVGDGDEPLLAGEPLIDDPYVVEAVPDILDLHALRNATVVAVSSDTVWPYGNITGNSTYSEGVITDGPAYYGTGEVLTPWEQEETEEWENSNMTETPELNPITSTVYSDWLQKSTASGRKAAADLRHVAEARRMKVKEAHGTQKGTELHEKEAPAAQRVR